MHNRDLYLHNAFYFLWTTRRKRCRSRSKVAAQSLVLLCYISDQSLQVDNDLLVFLDTFIKEGIHVRQVNVNHHILDACSGVRLDTGCWSPALYPWKLDVNAKDTFDLIGYTRSNKFVPDPFQSRVFFDSVLCREVAPNITAYFVLLVVGSWYGIAIELDCERSSEAIVRENNTPPDGYQIAQSAICLMDGQLET